MEKLCVSLVLLFALPVLCIAGDPYAEEKVVIESMCSVMEAYSAAMASADSPEEVIAAVDMLADGLEEVGPGMKKVSKEHPGWIDAPPEEVREVMERYMKAAGAFSASIDKAMKRANEWSDHQKLQEAIGRLNRIIYGM
jgi:hypothetical protein